MEWEDFLELIKILDRYDIAYSIGDYYDEEQEVVGHWLHIQEQEIDSEEV